jgi:regulator of sigma D
LTGAKKRIQTMAVTKLQVNLNNLINRNKASLGMYDDICQLFNDYTSSGGFDKYAKLKKRKPFLRSIESMYNTQSS